LQAEKKVKGKEAERIFVSWTVIFIPSLSSSLNVGTSRFLASVVRNRKHEPKCRRWSSKGKGFGCLYPKVYPRFLCNSPVPISSTF
jgi:hypothetical protein